MESRHVAVVIEPAHAHLTENTDHMKTLTWNVNKAGQSRSELWRTLQREDPDIAMLQEVTMVPEEILRTYNCYSRFPMFFGGHNARFQTAILSKWEIDTKPFLTSELAWVNRIHSERYGWILECEITDDEGRRHRVVSIHSPAFPVPCETLEGEDVSSIKLKNNPHLWFTEIIWSLLRNANIADEQNWIVGGDFNSSVRFDFPRDRGNREIVERLNTIGLIDCLSHFKGGVAPTFQHTSNIVEHQLDYCYVNTPMLDRLTGARVLSCEEVFGSVPRLSDHLPILCEFD